MKSRLTILVAYGSWHIGARIIHRLSGMPNVEIVGQARETDEVIGLITTTKPRLIIVDVQLALGTGLGVLRHVRRSETHSLVMMTSASSYSQYRRECVKEGADFFFTLPDEIDDLGKAVLNLAQHLPSTE